ncbi:MAG: hypothetical protein NTW21_14565 [Verrucomicrobia bacterium]|nr:hypothetical protein [Verrucomicrobiota bacterium]
MNQSEQYRKDLDKLILVAGHAVYAGDDQRTAAEDRAWVLQEFQKGEPPRYIEHIRCGVELAAAHPRSLLLFSGGKTRLEAGSNSEAMGYWRLADQFDWWQQTEVKDRASVEEFARDSFENLIFGIARFRECTGHYPASIEIVSWEFKRDRFDFHRQTIRWPGDVEHYQYHGARNPDTLDSALKREASTFTAFNRDPFGTEEPLLSKRKHRNPFNQTPPYPLTCPEIAGLLGHRTRDAPAFNGVLPWGATIQDPKTT